MLTIELTAKAKIIYGTYKNNNHMTPFSKSIIKDIKAKFQHLKAKIL